MTRRAWRLVSLALPPDLVFPTAGKSGYSEASMGKWTWPAPTGDAVEFSNAA